MRTNTTRANRKPSAEPRDQMLRIRLSESERKLLGDLAAAAGVSIAGYVLGAALGDALGDAITRPKQDPAQTRIKGV